MQARGENSWADGAILRRASRNCLLGFSGGKGPSWPYLLPALPSASFSSAPFLPRRGSRGATRGRRGATSGWNLRGDERRAYAARAPAASKRGGGPSVPTAQPRSPLRRSSQGRTPAQSSAGMGWHGRGRASSSSLSAISSLLLRLHGGRTCSSTFFLLLSQPQLLSSPPPTAPSPYQPRSSSLPVVPAFPPSFPLRFPAELQRAGAAGRGGRTVPSPGCRPLSAARRVAPGAREQSGAQAAGGTPSTRLAQKTNGRRKRRGLAVPVEGLKVCGFAALPLNFSGGTKSIS